MLTASFCVSRDHPCLAGHFPEYPVIPGVVALDLISESLLREIDGAHICGYPQIKFHAPIYPDKKVTVQFTKKKDFLYDFTCEVGDMRVISGKLRLAPNGYGDG